MGSRPRAVISWGSGKDSAYALYKVQQAAELEVVGALTNITETFGRVAMHGVREELLDRQLQALGLRGYKVPLPSPCPNAMYERAMERAIAELRADGVTHMVFGDVFLEDVRAYREAKLAGTGITPVFPLWQHGTRALAEAIIDEGLHAIVACVDPRRVDRTFAGRAFDRALLRALPHDVDPCAERGEFHTVLVDGPMFSAPIETRMGAVVERDGFVYADIIPVN